MTRAARVTSIDVLPLLSAALQKFRGQAVGVLDDLDIEARRILEWIHHDRKEYWERELHRAQEKLNQARLQLQQARMTRRVGDHEAACLDEKRAVAVAQRRVETARQKIDAVRHWTRVIERAVEDFLRGRSRFAAWLDVDFPRATAALDQMSEALVTYITLEAGSAADPTPAADATAPADAAPLPAEGPNGPVAPVAPNEPQPPDVFNPEPAATALPKRPPDIKPRPPAAPVQPRPPAAPEPPP
jgi:hypothetical protein